MPTADLLDEKPGQADETELGITYDQLDDYLEGKSVPADVAEKSKSVDTVSEHKDKYQRQCLMIGGNRT